VVFLFLYPKAGLGQEEGNTSQGSQREAREHRRDDSKVRHSLINGNSNGDQNCTKQESNVTVSKNGAEAEGAAASVEEPPEPMGLLGKRCTVSQLSEGLLEEQLDTYVK